MFTEIDDFLFHPLLYDFNLRAPMTTEIVVALISHILSISSNYFYFALRMVSQGRQNIGY